VSPLCAEGKKWEGRIRGSSNAKEQAIEYSSLFHPVAPRKSPGRHATHTLRAPAHAATPAAAYTAPPPCRHLETPANRYSAGPCHAWPPESPDSHAIVSPTPAQPGCRHARRRLPAPAKKQMLLCDARTGSHNHRTVARSKREVCARMRAMSAARCAATPAAQRQSMSPRSLADAAAITSQ
jgi:hypothetical protein